MRLTCRIAKCGFDFAFREHDFDLGENQVTLAFFWRKEIPRRAWRISYDDYADQRSVSFRTYHNGKRSGWRVRGPIERLT